MLCLATSLTDLKERLSRMVVGYTYSDNPVTAGDLHAAGAMTALLRDALKPNLVQTLEGTPGDCSRGTLCEHRARVQLGDRHENGDGGRGLCRNRGGLRRRPGRGEISGHQMPYGGTDAGRGGGGCNRPGAENARRRGKDRPGTGGSVCPAPGTAEPAAARVEHPRGVRLPCVVAINAFPTDTAAELACVEAECAGVGVKAILSTVWAEGGKGGEALAREVVRLCREETPDFRFPYPDSATLREKIEAVATKVYRADGVNFLPAAEKQLDKLESMGFGTCPVCIAKTQYSFSDDPTRLGAPEHFTLTVRNVKISAGAGFAVVLTGRYHDHAGTAEVPRRGAHRCGRGRKNYGAVLTPEEDQNAE